MRGSMAHVIFFLSVGSPGAVAVTIIHAMGTPPRAVVTAIQVVQPEAIVVPTSALCVVTIAMVEADQRLPPCSLE
jgi:hypothetical protein